VAYIYTLHVDRRYHRLRIGISCLGDGITGLLPAAQRDRERVLEEEHARRATGEAERTSDIICAPDSFQCSRTWEHKEIAWGGW